MELTPLIVKLQAYGADIKGIDDRFVGDAQLYRQCLDDFWAEPCLTALKPALAAGDYEGAFIAAHALKGLTGNLGLTPCYDVVCALVEALRSHDYAQADARYKAVESQLARIHALLTEEPLPPTEEPELPSEPAPVTEPASAPPAPALPLTAAKKAKPTRDRLISITLVALVAAVAMICLMYSGLIRNYREGNAVESASHLAEINYQIKLYIEERIASDWRAAYSIAHSIAKSGFDNRDAELFQFMLEERDIWGISDVILYTADGYSICADGSVNDNDVASEMVVQARQSGEFMTILDSDITYTIPIQTSQRYRGAELEAVSLVQNMSSFLDNMGFSSFDGSVYMYLTQENGMIVSYMSHPKAKSAFSILSLFGGQELRSIGREGLTVEDMLTTTEPVTFRLNQGGEKNFIVCTPIDTGHEVLRLFYVVPEYMVNKTLEGFSRYVTRLSVVSIAIFAVGAVVIFLAVFQLRKRKFDQALLAREHMFDLLVDNTQTAFGLFSVNEQQPIFISGNAERIMGDRYFSLVKTDDGYQLRNSSTSDTPAIRQLNAELLDWDGGGEFRSGFVRKGSEAEASYFDLQLFPVDTDATEYVGIAQNVTRTYEREEAAKNALIMAERSNEAKSRFLSNMSHDIRTPMNAIINMTDFAIESIGDPKKQSEYLQTIGESSAHLLRIINDVLDMSRIESGLTNIESAPFDILAELNRLRDITLPLCDARQQTLITDFSGIHTNGILGDQVKVSQILMNLLSNAIKFTPEKGAVRFSAAELPSLRENLVDLRFTVEDTGIGISKADLPLIFQPFTRVDDKRISHVEGTGLGLSICHSYVDAMGGSIHCESEVGNGSTFVVELFFQKAQVQPDTPRESRVWGEQPFLGRRCLLCEDNHINQVIARTILERVGFLVETAVDGREGLLMFRRSPAEYYDVIYMDIQMPGLDGYQTAIAIRESDHPRAGSIPIIAMTANVFLEDIEKARIAGMNGHLGKPLITLDLLEETSRVLPPDCRVDSP